MTDRRYESLHELWLHSPLRDYRGCLRGMHIVVTGRCPDLDRVYLYNMLGSMDAVVTEHVSSSETILLAFDPGKNTRKIKDARAFGCRIVDETGMLNTILTAMALDHAARATVLSVESIRPLESLS